MPLPGSTWFVGRRLGPRRRVGAERVLVHPSSSSAVGDTCRDVEALGVVGERAPERVQADTGVLQIPLVGRDRGDDARARRVSEDADPVGVDAVLLPVIHEEADRVRNVLIVGRVRDPRRGCRPAQAVVDGRERPALVVEEPGLVAGEPALVADRPATTVDTDHERHGIAPLPRGREVQVERQEVRVDPVDRVVAEVAHDAGGVRAVVVGLPPRGGTGGRRSDACGQGNDQDQDGEEASGAHGREHARPATCDRERRVKIL